MIETARPPVTVASFLRRNAGELMNPRSFTPPFRRVGAACFLIAFQLMAASAAAYHATKLIAPDGEPFDSFGVGAAIEGNTAIIGAWNGNDGDGAAYVYDVSTNQLRFELAPTVTSSQFFGYTVALSGEKAVIGQWFGFGSAYLFDVDTGEHLFRLRANDEAFDDKFGTSVDISGNTVIVGSPNDKDRGFGSGSAYLFDASTGAPVRKLIPADNGAGDNFGVSVAISGNRALVGAWRDHTTVDNSGSAYVFDTMNGEQLMKLTANDAIEDNEFGVAVALDDNLALVSARGNDHAGDHSGAAYLFDITTGQQLMKLTADDAAPGDEFGESVSLSGNIAMVGALEK